MEKPSLGTSLTNLRKSKEGGVVPGEKEERQGGGELKKGPRVGVHALCYEFGLSASF